MLRIHWRGLPRTSREVSDKLVRVLRSAIHFAFGVREPSAPALLWVALTLANVALMVALGWRERRTWWGCYLGVMAAAALTQASPLWGIWGEGALALASVLWIAETLPAGRWGVAFALAIGGLGIAAMLYALPPPYGAFPGSLYLTRLYSTAGLFGVALGSVILPWSQGDGVRWRTALALPWLGAVLFAGTQRGLDRWVVANVSNAIWTTCLVAWLILPGPPRRFGVPGGAGAARNPASETPPQAPRE